MLTLISRKEPEEVLAHELVDFLGAKEKLRLQMTGDELKEFDDLMEKPR
jgi:hypothetical protein